MDVPQIARRVGLIQKYKEEIKVAKLTLKQALEEDQLYTQADKEAKESNLKKKQIKDQIWGRPELRKVRDDILTNQEEINTLQEILNEELTEYYQEHNTDELMGEDGQPIKFKLVAKLLSKGLEDR